MFTIQLIVVLALGMAAVDCASYLPKLVYTLEVRLPAFASFVPNKENSKYHLTISSFNGVPFSPDFAYYVPNFSLDGNNTIIRLDNTDLLWPNEISYSSYSIYGSSVDPYGGLFAAGGFLVPSKTNGAIYYYPFESADRSKVSSAKPILLSKRVSQEWFYHRIIQVDISGDGVEDILTCRSYKPVFGKTKVELVAFLYNSVNKDYDEKIILEDVCDVYLDVADLDGDGKFEIVAAGFFFSKLAVIYSDDESNSFINGKVSAKQIDENGGKFFDVKIIDLDLDGKLELLVTNHQDNDDAVKGSIFYYKLSGDVRTGQFERFVINDEVFPVLKIGFNQGSPGTAVAFWPKLSDENKTRPYLLVAGDGSEQAYVFEPSQTGPISYKLIWSQRYNRFTVGGVAVADVDGDGYAEAVIPTYESNKAYVYTFAPSSHLKKKLTRK